jgi:hypothetical protein
VRALALGPVSLQHEVRISRFRHLEQRQLAIRLLPVWLRRSQRGGFPEQQPRCANLEQSNEFLGHWPSSGLRHQQLSCVKLQDGPEQLRQRERVEPEPQQLVEEVPQSELHARAHAAP